MIALIIFLVFASLPILTHADTTSPKFVTCDQAKIGQGKTICRSGEAGVFVVATVLPDGPHSVVGEDFPRCANGERQGTDYGTALAVTGSAIAETGIPYAMAIGGIVAATGILMDEHPQALPFSKFWRDLAGGNYSVCAPLLLAVPADLGVTRVQFVQYWRSISVFGGEVQGKRDITSWPFSAKNKRDNRASGWKTLRVKEEKVGGRAMVVSFAEFRNWKHDEERQVTIRMFTQRAPEK